MDTQDLAREAVVGVNTINRFEAGQDARVSSVEKMRSALEAAGLEFIPENGAAPGSGSVSEHSAVNLVHNEGSALCDVAESIAAAAVAVGGISPTIAATSGVISFTLAAILVPAWIVVGLGLHLFARAILGRLRDTP